MSDDVYYDMYSVEINADPYPVYRRLREEAPLYYNDTHDFWAVSRYEDVEKGLLDAQTYISGKGAILEVIKADIDIPPGVIIFEDPPTHTIHRRLLSRAFTPRRVAELEPKIREFCAHALDPLVGSGGFDFIADFGAQMPMRVISMLLGIPESDQEAVRDHANNSLRTEEGKPMEVTGSVVTGELFAEYIDWRVDHPSDDIMTELLNVEFTDETGTVRKLSRGELLTYLEVLAGAGNETTTRLIGWTAKVLAEHPDQRADLVKDPSLVPNAIEELLRFEGPAPHVGRCVAKEDLVVRDTKIPAGSVMVFLLGSANRDDRRFPDGDSFDIHREVTRHLTFGNGIHLCMGSALARMEGRIALEELLVRIPEWDIDYEKATTVPHLDGAGVGDAAGDHRVAGGGGSQDNDASTLRESGAAATGARDTPADHRGGMQTSPTVGHPRLASVDDPGRGGTCRGERAHGLPLLRERAGSPGRRHEPARGEGRYRAGGHAARGRRWVRRSHLRPRVCVPRAGETAPRSDAQRCERPSEERIVDCARRAHCRVARRGTHIGGRTARRLLERRHLRAPRHGVGDGS